MHEFSPFNHILLSLFDISNILEMCEFSSFNYILLSLFDILNVFHDNILANIITYMCETV